MAGPIVVGPGTSAAQVPFGLSAGTQSVSTGTLILSNSNNVTFGMSGSSRVTASASFPAETPFGLSAGTQSVSTGTLIFSDSNGISFGMSGSSRITASYTVPTETPFGVSAGTQSVSTGTLIFSNSNNVTFGMSGSSRVTASASFAAETPFGVSAGTQSVSTGTLIFSDSNGISFGMSGSSRITASYTVPTETPFGVSAGTQSVSTGTLVFSNSNNVTFGMSGSSRVTASASFAAETPFGISAGTQSVSTGTMVFSDSNGISFGMSGSSRITASYTVPTLPVVSNGILDVSTATGSGTGVTQFAAHDHVHRGIRAIDINGTASTFFGNFDISAGSLMALSTGGNTTAGSVAIHNLLSSATTVSSVTSANAVGAMASRFALEGHQHAGVGPAGVSNIGNTAGNTTVMHGQIVFAGGNNVTLSVSSSNNNNQTITISAAAAAPGPIAISAGTTSSSLSSIVFSNSNNVSFGLNGSTITGSVLPNNSVGFSTGGNTLGDTGLVTGRVVFVGTNNLTLSGSTNAGSMTVTISGPTGGGAGVSTMGNTDGSTGTVGGQYLYVGTNGITLSQSTNGNSATMTIAGPSPEVRYVNEPSITNANNSAQNASLVSFVPVQIPFQLQMSNLRFGVSLNVATAANASSAYVDLSCSAVLYTRTSDSLSSILSGSNTYTVSWSSNATGSVTGARGLSLDWNASTRLERGEYWVAMHISTTNSATGGANTTALANSWSGMIGVTAGQAAVGLDPFGVGTQLTRGASIGLGCISTGATRASQAISAISQTGTRALAAKLWLDFRNYSLW